MKKKDEDEIWIEEEVEGGGERGEARMGRKSRKRGRLEEQEKGAGGGYYNQKYIPSLHFNR